MLPTSLVRVRFNRNRVAPQYLDASHDTWIELAEQVLGIFQGQTNLTRGELEEELEEAIGNHPAQIVARGLAKLLEDRCEFEVVSDHAPDELRDKVFLLAANRRTAGEFDRSAVLDQVSAELGMSAKAVEQGVF